MLLRRISDHVKTQNWTAIALDFAIVVVGVFIGVQLSNWNAVWQTELDYERALERYAAELEINLETLQTAEADALQGLRIVGAAIDALQTCEDTDENRAVIEAGIKISMGTYGLHLRANALRNLTDNSDLLERQSEAERQRFQETRYYVDLFLREAEFVEIIPLNERLQNNPMIKVGPLANRDTQYVGVDFSRPERNLLLAAPVDDACKDNLLASSLYTWERWQGALPAIIRVLRDELEDDRSFLEN